jgi:protocatechuate 3,4-dioxygenase beta subunit
MKTNENMTNSERKMGRREALAMLGATGAALAVGCAGESPIGPGTVASAAESATTTGTATGGACAVTPNETAGPFPSLVDLFRSDIRENRSRTQLDLALTVVNTAAGCASVSGVNVEIWQCDASGNYSEYGSERGQTYLRGIQTTDANGRVTFTTIYPGWYQGRATHIHIEVTRNGQTTR